jgi:hypothetical protein
MTSSQIEPFRARVRRIERTHDRIAAHGATAKLGKDGLIVMQPKRALSLSLSLPRLPGLRSLLVLGVLAFGVKVGAYAALGPDAYADRLAGLGGGDVVRQAGAFVLEPDPATVWVHARLMELRALVGEG